MLQDRYGQDVTTDQRSTVDAIDVFMDGFLGNEASAGCIVQAARDDPDCALARAYAAALMMLMESPAGHSKAREIIGPAVERARDASSREIGVVEAIAAWTRGDVLDSIRLGEALVRTCPTEIVTAKLVQTHCFNLGDAPGMLRTAHHVAAAHDDNPHLHGMLAFGYEQCHLLVEAEAAARRAIEMKRKEPWAQHALAHVLLTDGRTDEGIAFLEDIRDTWVGLSSFMYTHNWWHLCLFLLDRGAYDRVLSIYDEHVWGVDKTYSQDQVGAVSLLLRLELHGIDVGSRWQDVATYLQPRTQDHVQPFLDLHYVYGLARAGVGEADQLLASMEQHANAAAPPLADRWLNVAVPAARGLIAHARGEYDATIQHLEPTISAMSRIGGSHAQRELFDLVLLDAEMRCGRLVSAQQKLELARRRDESAPFVWRQLAHVYEGLGLAAEASNARARSGA
jgi:tetratricopeptide (TPR) repeat protein